MSDAIDRVLITGADGRVGTALREQLRGRFTTLRLFDRNFRSPRQDGEELFVGDLLDAESVGSAMSGCDAVVHLAGIPDEVAPFADILTVNVGGTQAVLEAARAHGVRRVVIASTSRVTGFHRRDERLDPSAAVRPDTFYAVSKVACEALGRFYADRFGLEVVCLRIGSFAPWPASIRHLSTWLSPHDLAEYVQRCLIASDISYLVMYAVSANQRAWWDDADAQHLGVMRRDDAERFAAEVDEDRSAWTDVQGLPAPDSVYRSLSRGDTPSHPD